MVWHEEGTRSRFLQNQGRIHWMGVGGMGPSEEGGGIRPPCRWRSRGKCAS